MTAMLLVWEEDLVEVRMKVAGREIVNAVWRTWVCKGKME